MTLHELFEGTSPSVVGFICKIRATGIGLLPLFPQLFGTGFFVDSDGIAVTNNHVVELFEKLPKHPKTGASSLGAILFLPGDKGASQQMLVLDVKGWTGLGTFSSSADWYGSSVPDIGFVQLNVRDVATLTLASENHYIEIGMDVATVGYPLGDAALTALGKINQVSASIRHGIVSSVFPFPTAKPHGFTIDIMQQGGSSGSPVLRREDSHVVGMMSSSVLDWTAAVSNELVMNVAHNTNLSICEPAHIIGWALAEFRRQCPLDLTGVPTLHELRSRHPFGGTSEGLSWDSLAPTYPR